MPAAGDEEGSEPLAHALDRALGRGGWTAPVIAFAGSLSALGGIFLFWRAPPWFRGMPEAATVAIAVATIIAGWCALAAAAVVVARLRRRRHHQKARRKWAAKEERWPAHPGWMRLTPPEAAEIRRILQTLSAASDSGSQRLGAAYLAAAFGRASAFVAAVIAPWVAWSYLDDRSLEFVVGGLLYSAALLCAITGLVAARSWKREGRALWAGLEQEAEDKRALLEAAV